MNILVYDVAASESGALTVLQDFYHQVVGYEDKNIKWIFAVSVPELQNTDNITVLKYPWVKKGWLFRLIFDIFYTSKIISKYKVDRVFSLQNTTIPNVDIEQILYIHNSLPFVEYRFGYRENKLFWIYQNIIGKIIKHSIKRANKIITQTQWMKDACIQQTNENIKKFEVIPPIVEPDMQCRFEDNLLNRKTFFYPATPLSYKNHLVILKACELLQQNGIFDYKVIFTFKGNDSEYATYLFNYAREKNLNVEFVGVLAREEVFKMYSKSVLLFASYIESCPIPLVEALILQDIILASDCAFSKEILANYNNGWYFETHNPQSLMVLMKKCMDKTIKYIDSSDEVKYESECKYKLVQSVLE